MIQRLGPFEWFCAYGYLEQRVVGTRHSAEQTLRILKEEVRRDTERLPLFSRLIARINLFFLEMAETAH
jgi:hypothetical protein